MMTITDYLLIRKVNEFCKLLCTYGLQYISKFSNQQWQIARFFCATLYNTTV